MSLNLHATVRRAIRTVNKDITAAYIESTGYTMQNGRQVPQYAAAVDIQIQIQPPTSKDLAHMEFLNIQGTTRVVYLYSDPDAIRRIDAKGGDKLQFSSFVGNPVDNWLVVAVPERWNVGQNGLVTFDAVGNLTATSDSLDVTAVNSGFLNVGDQVADSAGSLPDNTVITGLGSGTGGIGTYTMSHEAQSTQDGDTIVVTNTKGISGWSKLFVVLQLDRPPVVS